MLAVSVGSQGLSPTLVFLDAPAHTHEPLCSPVLQSALCLLGTKEIKLSIPEKQERKLQAILTGEPYEEEKERETFRMGLKFRCPFCEKPLSTNALPFL